MAAAPGEAMGSCTVGGEGVAEPAVHALPPGEERYVGRHDDDAEDEEEVRGARPDHHSGEFHPPTMNSKVKKAAGEQSEYLK